jgi:hypothetical protein
MLRRPRPACKPRRRRPAGPGVRLPCRGMAPQHLNQRARARDHSLPWRSLPRSARPEAGRVPDPTTEGPVHRSISWNSASNENRPLEGRPEDRWSFWENISTLSTARCGRRSSSGRKGRIVVPKRPIHRGPRDERSIFGQFRTGRHRRGPRGRFRRVAPADAGGAALAIRTVPARGIATAPAGRCDSSGAGRCGQLRAGGSGGSIPGRRRRLGGARPAEERQGGEHLAGAARRRCDRCEGLQGSLDAQSTRASNRAELLRAITRLRRRLA